MPTPVTGPVVRDLADSQPKQWQSNTSYKYIRFTKIFGIFLGIWDLSAPLRDPKFYLLIDLDNGYVPLSATANHNAVFP